MLNLIYFFICIVILIFITVYHSNEIRVQSRRIRVKIEKQGGHQVNVNYNWLWGPKGAYNFDVLFSNAEGKRFRTNCTINRSTYDIFWTKSPGELLLKDDSKTLADKNDNKETVNTSKEELINDLYLENQKLKEQIERMGQESKDSGLGE